MSSFLLVDTIEKLKDLSEKWVSKEFAFDTEFTSLSFMKQRIIGMSIYDEQQDILPTFIQFNFEYIYTEKEADPKGGRAKIDVNKLYTKTDAIEFEEAKPYLLKIFEGAKCICANAKVEWKIFTKYGITNWKIEDDVNLMSWLLNVETDSDLKSNAKKELGISMPSYTDTIGQKVTNINWHKVDWNKYAEYGAKDAYATYKLRDILLEQVSEFPKLLRCYKHLEIPLIYEVARSEMAGVKLDTGLLKEMSQKIALDIELYKDNIFDEIGVEFNLGSSKQLAEILYDRLGYPVLKTSDKTGARSCDEDSLKELSFLGYEVADAILEYRGLEKLKNTYLDALPLMVDVDGRLRGNFNAQGTKTGRFSSSKPNLQNIANNKKYPVKAAFVPKKGYKFLIFDWNTIEIRVMAHESKDKKLIALLNEGRDIHQETTNSINSQFGLTLTRSDGKTINFAVLYLMGSKSLAYTLNKGLQKQLKQKEITNQEYKKRYVTERMAQQIIDGYFNTYTGFAEFVQNEVDEVRRTGWSWTLGGHRRPVLGFANKKTFGIAQRIAANTPIQGGAADLMKLGILKLAQMYKENNFDATTLLYVHDEYVIEVKENQAEKCAEKVKEVLQNIFPKCLVPILCEGGVYDNWQGLKGGAKAKKKSNKLDLARLIALRIIKSN